MEDKLSFCNSPIEISEVSADWQASEYKKPDVRFGRTSGHFDQVVPPEVPTLLPCAIISRETVSWASVKRDPAIRPKV